MGRRRRKLKRRLLLFAYALGVVVVILLLPARLTAPARVLFTQLGGPAERVVFRAGGDTLAATGTLRDAFLARERSKALEQRLARLSNENLRLRQLYLDQERRLESFQHLEVHRFSFRAVSAAVTAYDSSPMHHSITIAAGTRDGIRTGLAVCSAGAVVGRVAEAGPWDSRARLITDAGSELAARLQRTGHLCVLKGTGGVNCSVEWVDQDASVQEADVLVTAAVNEGLSRPPEMPAGLPVAAVVRARPGRSDPLFQSVTAAPRARLERLEMVEVIIPEADLPQGAE